MGSVSVLVPIDCGPDRKATWSWLRERYREQLPGWELKVGSAPAHGWSKGRAVESAMRQAAGDILVIADADSWVSSTFLRLAVGMVDAGAPWVVPHALVRRLNPTSSSLVVRGRLRIEDLTPGHRARVHEAVAGGGVSVLSRAAYLEVGGIDVRFRHWGGEDIAFGWALDTLVGPHEQLSATLWHLHHPDDPFRRASSNDVLAGRYRHAYGKPAAMRELVDEAVLARYAPPNGRTEVHPTRPRGRSGNGDGRSSRSDPPAIGRRGRRPRMDHPRESSD